MDSPDIIDTHKTADPDDGSITSYEHTSGASDSLDHLMGTGGFIDNVQERLGGGISLTLTQAMESKYANDMNSWLKEVARIENSSTSGGSSGGSSEQYSVPLKVVHTDAQTRDISLDSTDKKIDPQFFNAVASFEEIVNSGPPSHPPDFPSATFSNVVRVNASVYNPETGEEIIIPNILFEVRQDGRPPERAYWIGRKLKTAKYGCVCACSVLKAREGGWTGSPERSLWEITPELAAVKIIDNALACQLQWKNSEDPIKEAAAMQFCSKSGTEPNLLELYDLFRDEEYIYMFMPYCSKGELFHCIKRNGRFDEPVAKFWFKQLLSALISLQKKGICHRDISLENILINENTHALVIDLGMCLQVPFKMPSVSKVQSPFDTLRLLLHPQGACGKPNYMSPELLANTSPFDGYAIDIWAVGIVLFTMLVGIPPFEWASVDDPRYQLVCRGGLNDLLTRWKRPISPLAADLLQSMLRENPHDRLTLFQIMNHPWVLQESSISLEDLKKLHPDDDDDSDDAMDCSDEDDGRIILNKRL